jgi:MFS family permease
MWLTGVRVNHRTDFGHVIPPLFTRAFVLAWFANGLLNLAAFLFLHLPGFLQGLGAGEAQIGRIMAAQAVGAIVAWPLAGRAMDARGRRVVILAGVALFVLVVGLYLAIDSLGPGIYAVRVLDGVAATLWYTALFTYAADIVPVQRRIEGLAMFGVSGLISIGLGAQSGDVILAHATYRELFLVALGCATLGLMLCLSLHDVRRVHSTSVPPRSAAATAVERNLLPVWLAAFTFFVGVAAVFTFMKTFATTTGIGNVGVFFGGYAAIAVALRVLLGWLPDRLGARRTLGIAMSAYVVGLGALSLAQAPWHVFAAGLLCGAGHGYTFPVLLSLVVARARPQERGAATAFFVALDWIALLLAGPIVGYVIEHSGYGTAFISHALLLVMGIALFYGLDRQDDDRNELDAHGGIVIKG